MAFDWTPPIYFDPWCGATSEQGGREGGREDDKEKVNHT